jgi:glutathione peroxidase-family protein
MLKQVYTTAFIILSSCFFDAIALSLPSSDCRVAFASGNHLICSRGGSSSTRIALLQRGGGSSSFNNHQPSSATAMGTSLLSTSTSTSVDSFFDLSAPDLQGNVVNFNDFRGKVTIITNVASRCGYTASHYKGLVELWSQVKDKNVNILAFPCNQFMRQEPGSAEDIARFAESKGVEFTMMSKINVNGDDADPVYKFLKEQTDTDIIRWNFATYFVVAPDGTITAYNGIEPMDLLDIVSKLSSSD